MDFTDGCAISYPTFQLLAPGDSLLAALCQGVGYPGGGLPALTIEPFIDLLILDSTMYIYL